MRPIATLKDGVRYELRPSDSGVFYIHWSEGRRSRRESTRQKELAAASAYLEQWLLLRNVESRGAALTCADLWPVKYDKAGDRVRYAWTNLESVFGALSPKDVTTALVDRYIADRKAGRIGKKPASPSTIRFEIGCLYTSWNYAADRRRRIISPDDIPVLDPLPPASPPRDRWLSDAEIAALLAAAEAARGASPRLSRVERFCWIALDACARRTAIQDLRWDTGQVDFETGVVDFNPPGREQTSKRRAAVPMSARLRAVLERAYAERSGPWVLDSNNVINGPLRLVAARSGVKGVTPHVLRHTAATHMARRGVSLWIIAKLLGNTVEQIEKTYAKFAPDMGRDAVEVIGGPRLKQEN